MRHGSGTPYRRAGPGRAAAESRPQWMAMPAGPPPTLIVLVTLSVATSITETLLLVLFTT